MPASGARILANRQNAQRSTGPRTAEGKDRSRRNALKHGLAGEGVVVIESDRDEIDARARALEADLAPKSPLGALMIAKLATLSVRAERAADRESAAIAGRVRHAVDDFDDERLDRVDALFDSLADDPRRALRRLKRMPEGVDRLVDAWSELGDDLMLDVPGAWTPSHGDRATLLTGQVPGKAWGSRVEAWSRAALGDFAGLDPSEGAGLDPEGRRHWAKDQLLGRVAAELAALAEAREAIDLGALELDRIEAPDRALFDPSKEAALARRYESEASRGFFKALAEFRRAEAEFAARAEAAPARPPAPAPAARLASSRQTAPPADFAPARAFPEARFAQGPVALGPDGRPVCVGRPPQAAR